MGLERYSVIRKVADGGMAEIFLATQTGAEGFSRTVVVKRILPAFSIDPHFRNMIVDEAHIAMSLQHSNIVQVLDLGQTQGRYFLVMEMVDGWDLATIVVRSQAAGFPIPTGLCLYLTGEVCRALAYAHGKSQSGKPLGIVHRDISPQNVLVSEQGEVKLTDFGIAKALGKRDRTQTGVIKGKLDFMSPEQAAGGALDQRSDIFSVGTVLYLLATGRRPFEATLPLETLVRIQNAQFVPPEQVAPTLSTKVTTILRRAMAKDVAARYPSADHMMRDVEDALRGEFRSVGQSELKRYLEELARRDREPPFSRKPNLLEELANPEGSEPRRKPPTSPPLALEDTQFHSSGELEGPASLPVTGEAMLERRPPRGSGRRGALVVLGLAAAGAAAYTLGPRLARRAQREAPRRLPAPEPPRAETADRETKPDKKLARKPDPTPARREREDDPPDPSRPVPGVVTVRVTSRPAGALVRNRSGATLGNTPFSLSLRPGTAHNLTFTKRGYATASRKVVVGNSNEAVVVELTRAGRRSSRR
jgi:serine/threonine protein kinase